MVARRDRSPALHRITSALADMCVRFQKRLSAISATKETGYLHWPEAACDIMEGNLTVSVPDSVGALPEAEEGDKEAGKMKRRRRARADLGPEPEPVGPAWPGPIKYSG